uniref:Lipocalin/cytosolic fatty-acid binding domain-containing protein n=1 Tax=Equus asinus TaxID=9793 RepID=A0A8C4MGQ0_EQUAS
MVIVVNRRGPVTACHVARNPLLAEDKRATVKGSEPLSEVPLVSLSHSCLTMNLLLLAMGLILLGGPHALHMGPGDPNFDEKLVKGKWFSVALASNEPKFIAKDTDMKFFIHKIQVTPVSLQFHFHRKVRGMCVPTMMTAHKTKKKFQYTVNHSGHKTIFLEKVDPKHFVIFCAHSMKHGKETVVVTLFSRTPTVSPDVMWMFKKYCKTHGIHASNIVDLTQTDRCLHARH